MPIERKLTAIVFTDIAGFAELSAQDEENAFELILDYEIIAICLILHFIKMKLFLSMKKKF